MGNIFAPAIATATYGVARTDAGVASAMVNTMQQVGGSIGTALLSSIFASAVTLVREGQAAEPPGRRRAAVHGYTVAFWVAAASSRSAPSWSAPPCGASASNRPRRRSRRERGRGTGPRHPHGAAHEALRHHARARRLDLVVEPGEVYGYLGPNGAGKTTTIRLLLGLHRPTGGRAELFGTDAWRDPVRAHRRVAYVAGEPFLWPALTGAETLSLPRAAARRHGRRVPRRAGRALPARHATRRFGRSPRATARRCS